MAVTVFNRGSRRWDLRDGKEVDGKVVARVPLKNGEPDPTDKVVKRSLKPNEAIETLDDAEAAQLLSYHREIVDASKLIKANGDKEKIEALTVECDALKARVAELEAMLPKEEDEEGKGKGSKKK